MKDPVKKMKRHITYLQTTSLTKDLYLEYIELPKLNKKSNNPVRKWAENMKEKGLSSSRNKDKKYLLQGKQMSSMYMGGCSTSLAISH